MQPLDSSQQRQQGSGRRIPVTALHLCHHPNARSNNGTTTTTIMRGENDAFHFIIRLKNGPSRNILVVNACGVLHMIERDITWIHGQYQGDDPTQETQCNMLEQGKLASANRTQSETHTELHSTRNRMPHQIKALQRSQTKATCNTQMTILTCQKPQSCFPWGVSLGPGLDA